MVAPETRYAVDLDRRMFSPGETRFKMVSNRRLDYFAPALPGLGIHLNRLVRPKVLERRECPVAEVGSAGYSVLICCGFVLGT